VTASDPRNPADFDVPVSPVEAHGSRRARIVAVVVLAVVAAGIGLAALSGSGRPSSPSGPLLAEASTSPATSGSSSAPPPAAVTASPPPQVLPAIDNVPLSGAPMATFYKRSGDDMVLLGWRTGSSLQRIGLIRDVYKGIATGLFTIGAVSPDGSRAIVRTIESYAGDVEDVVRVADAHGIVWQDAHVTARGSPLWSSDSRSLAIPLSRRQWDLLAFGDRVPQARRLYMRDINLPGPPPDLAFVSEPTGFSADGRWVYGQARSNIELEERTNLRVSTRGGRAERIERAPTTGPSRTISESVDPRTGRQIDRNSSPFGADPQLVVLDDHGGRSFEVTFSAILGSAWLADGRVVVMEADQWQDAKHVALVPVTPDGQVHDPLIEAGPVSGAGILESRNGFVLLGFAISRATNTEALAVLLRVSDGAVSALPLSPEDLNGLQLAGWRQ
jgi:hypothetical protein